MGLVFEHLIRKLAESANDSAGEFFTPRDVVRLATTLIFAPDHQALNGEGVVRTVYDCAAGTGGFLSLAIEQVAEWSPNASLVLDQGYSHTEASCSLGVVESALRRWVNQLQQERNGVTPQSKALTPEQQKIQELEARIARLEREKSILKGYRALDVGRARAHTLIDQLSAQEPVDWLCAVFDITRSCYYAHRLRRRTPDVERLRLRSLVNELFT